MLIVAHNLYAMNANRQLNNVTNHKAKTAEKLSSGYKINRAADNAAGLAISETMRRQIRGLNQGTRNAQDGISWIQTGDGALNEVHEILHRMSELSIQSMNGTNSDSDRMALQREFEHLQSEVDRISQTAKFNDKNIFEKHEIPYHQSEGDIKWDMEESHFIPADKNDLVIKYRKDDNSPQREIAITVPEGIYTTQELVDEIESAMEVKSASTDGLMFEYNSDGYCNMNLERGGTIDSVSGALSYLMYDMYEGGGLGALIGTTVFPDEYSKLLIDSPNNTMEFSIEDFNGNVTQKTIIIPNGEYTRSQLIDELNNQLKDTSVEAIAYGSGIKLTSDDSIVTGFKGNMFRIDEDKYTSVFYDNVKYGNVTTYSGFFQGGYIIPVNSKDVEHQAIKIDSSNNVLTLQPNGMNTATSLIIPDGEYSIFDMKDRLNQLFGANGLDVEATVNKSGDFYGLRITSKLKGLDSNINVDSGSSAYDSLFVIREYNQYGTGDVLVKENTPNREASFTGSKDLSSLNVVPLTVTAGVNDQFKLKVDGTESVITMTAKDYNSINDVVAELNRHLNGDVEAAVSGNSIIVKGIPGKGVKNIQVSANNTNKGYDAIFQGYNITYTTQTATGNGSVVLNTPFDGTVNPADNPMKITVGGRTYDVTLPTGTGIARDDIVGAIQAAIPGETKTTLNKFNDATGTGTTTNRSMANKTAVGTTTPRYWGDSDTGTTTLAQGSAGYATNIPAKITIGPKLTNNMVVTDANNTIRVTINNKTENIILTNGTYSKTGLQNELQKKIDAAYGIYYKGAIVGLEGDQLTLTARLNEIGGGNARGDSTSISCATTGSSFLTELNTLRTPAEWKSNNAIADNFTIDGSNNTFDFQYKENGINRTISLTLDHGNYTSSSFIAQLNKQLTAEGSGITASKNTSNQLVLTSKAVGNGVSISYATATGGSSAGTVFGPLTVKEKGRSDVNLKTLDQISIDNSTNQFSITVNGVKQTVTLINGDYSRDSFVSMLNERLAFESVAVRAYVNGNKIGYETLVAGGDQSFVMSYGDGGSSMKAIYGETTNVYPGVTAEFNPEGKLVLKTTDLTSSIRVSSANGGGLQKAKENKNAISTSTVSGYESNTYSYIDGVSLNGNIDIDQWNNNLNFTFSDNGVNKSIQITIPQMRYTHDALETTLQNLIDAQAGTDRLTVTVNNDGVRIQAVDAGSKYILSNFSGDFYDKVIRSCTEKKQNQTPSVTKGSQGVTSTYTIGRKDIRSQGANIRSGISDTLSLDLTYGGTVHKIEITLDPGKYNANQIKAHIQSKLNEKLVDMGLEENLIEVGVGGINTGIIGSNDSNALNFSLSKTVKAPAEGQFIIDGVSGNAAFEVFYQTDGKLMEAYVMGTKDISDGVLIQKGKDQLHFEVDGTSYDITLDSAPYTANGLKNHINKKLEEAGAPIVASLDNGKLKISHTRLGNHAITEISGSAKGEIFYRENGSTGVRQDLLLQLSSETKDNIALKRTTISTSFLGINSVCISKVKNAQKALNRVGEAIEKISAIRSRFGSMQNRLEHSIDNNNNKAENTQYAESRIRDTDMAKSLVDNAKHDILLQAGQAMLAQANQSNQGVLALLR